MTTISAGAAAGLLVALMVVSTSEGFGTEPQPPAGASKGAINGVNLQPDPNTARQISSSGRTMTG